MNPKKQVLLICGGAGSEHGISLITAQYISDSLADISEIQVHKIEMTEDGTRRDTQGRPCELRKSGELITADGNIKLHFAIPCFHGYPGETGDIQSVFEMMELPYLGSGPEASKTCFNKISTKLWLKALNIPSTPFVFLSDLNEFSIAQKAIAEWGGEAFIKASSQGSALGCYPLKKNEDPMAIIEKAFEFSPYVLVEKLLKPRELEVSVYTVGDEIFVSLPGEVSCPSGFYSYDEKYSEESETKTEDIAKNLPEEIVNRIQQYSRKIFEGLKLRHLARVDFFYTEDGNLYLNEVNTFPGMTPISMFPKMMAANGHAFSNYLQSIIQKEARS